MGTRASIRMSASLSRNGIPTLNRKRMVKGSSLNPNSPYGLDPALTFYCPQENLEALDLPVVKRFLKWAERDYQPVRSADPAVLLLIPCQKVKPYALSAEHRVINSHLLAHGYEPTGRGDWPQELAPLAPWELLSNAPLRGNGLCIDRAVISEPFGLVPYSAIYRWQNRLSPCARYDDPGLFEHRGLACPWRKDNTAVAQEGFWHWGDNERAAYVEVHNRLAHSMAVSLQRIARQYKAIYAYVAPLMTHRSFLVDAAQRKAVGLSLSRKVGAARRKLVGVNDLVPGMVRVIPDAAQLSRLRSESGRGLVSKMLSGEPALNLLSRALAC